MEKELASLTYKGLTQKEVLSLSAQGQINTQPKSKTRTVGAIFRDNLLTLFNFLNLSIAAVIIIVGFFDFKSGRFDFSKGIAPLRNVLFMGVVISSAAIGIFQELRAKITVDRLSILVEPFVFVIRDGKKEKIFFDKIVLGDLVLLSSGNQVCADGEVVLSEGLEADESLLTGESNHVLKKEGDTVLSGSFAAAGSGYIRVTGIGQNSYAASVVSESKTEKRRKSIIITSLNKIIKVLTFIIIPVALALAAAKLLSENDVYASIVGSSAAVVGMIPEGLILLTSIAFAVGVVNLGKFKVLVQSLPCIETLARVDTLCLDKTGTLTDGRLAVTDIIPLSNIDKDETVRIISGMMSLLKDKNPTAEALRAYFNAQSDFFDIMLSEIIPFSSKRKYSGIKTAENHTWLIGASEFILSTVPNELHEKITDISKKGLRVLLLAEKKEETIPVSLVVISDNLRPQAQATLKYFKNQNVELKIISGDSPSTVSAVTKRAGFEESDKYIDMSKVEDVPLDEIADKYNIFGRVSPYQKKELILALKKNGHTVAMTGDGVNDVLALNAADCAVAMANGSDAAKAAADLVLLNSDLSSLIPAVYEGRRVINNIGRVAALYVSKSLFSAMMALFYIFAPVVYPFMPIQLTLIGSLTIGIPSFFIALKPSREKVPGNFLKKVYLAALPAAISVFLSVTAIEITSYFMSFTDKQTSTLCTMIAGCYGFILLCKCSKPFDLKRIMLVCLTAAAFITAFLTIPDVFYLDGIFNKTAFVYIPLIAVSYPLYLFMTKILSMISQRFQ